MLNSPDSIAALEYQRSLVSSVVALHEHYLAAMPKTPDAMYWSGLSSWAYGLCIDQLLRRMLCLGDHLDELQHSLNEMTHDA